MIPENHYATRKPKYDHRSYLYVGNETFLVEATGEIKPRTDLPTFLLTYTGRECPVICTNDAPSLVKNLDDALSRVGSWVWRATPLRRTKRSAAKPPEAKAAVSVRLNPLYCGFKRGNGHSANRYFHFVDCVAITGNTSGHHYPDLDEIRSLTTFGQRYRSFCRDNGIPISSTRGKIGGAFLRDPRFFGESERHIPSHINETARENLPGNHYELRAEENTPLEGLYLDITSAHHDAAGRTNFPDPGGLRARGKRIEITGDRSAPVVPGGEPWAKSGSRKFEALLRTHGLVLLQCLYGGTPKGAILHPASRTATARGPNHVFAYTNELDLIRSSGFTITGIEAAWTSTRTSDSLNRYATHAVETLASTPQEDKPWVKSLLLSTYGMLGKRPTKYQSVSNVGGTEYKWPTPDGWLDGGIKQTRKEHSPATTNVIALGMIQAETRRNIIELARYLESMGVSVLALYADSIIVKSDSESPLPFLPPEWRVKTQLTNLRFINRVSWVSDQEERLPGVSRDEALRESRRSAIRARAYTDRVGADGEVIGSKAFAVQEWVHALSESHGRGPAHRYRSNRQFEAEQVIEARQVQLLRKDTPERS